MKPRLKPCMMKINSFTTITKSKQNELQGGIGSIGPSKCGFETDWVPCPPILPPQDSSK